MTALFSLWLALASAAPAAKLHKCVDAAGTPSYQTLPCSPGQRGEWVRDVPVVAPAPLWKPQVASPEPARRAARPQARPAPSREGETRCRQARHRAQEMRDRLWNRLSFRQRSELDAEVARACKR